ncbi:MAG: AAA family ATPase [Armatimonadota bacterium]|nr:AAA family ATPase [bacterium]
MKISEFFISGFGVFSGIRRDGLSGGLNVFVGDNEAGKSTLLAFFRAIFFGFEIGTSRENPYKPVADVEHGGLIKLHFDRDGRQYIIKRGPGRAQGLVEVTLPDGSIAGEEMIGQLIPGVTKDLYRNVFAFSLDELQGLESLKGQDVRSRIYSYGTGAGHISAVDVEKRLDSEMAALFSPRASRPAINALLAEIDNSQAKLRELSAVGGDYDNLRAQLAGLNKAIEEIETSSDAVHREIVRLEQMDKAWPSWESLYAARTSLERIPGIEVFPQDGVARLERLTEKLSDAKRRVELKRGDLEAEKQRQSEDDRSVEDNAAHVRLASAKHIGIVIAACSIMLAAAFRQNILAAAAFGLLGLIAAATGFKIQAGIEASEKRRRAELLEQSGRLRGELVERISREMQLLDCELRQAQEEREALIRAGGAADEEDFRRRASNYVRRNELLREIEKRESEIELIAGQGNGPAVESALTSTDQLSIGSALQLQREKRASLASELADHTHKRGATSQKIAEMEKSDELSDALLHERSLKAQLEKHSSEWASKAICRAILQQTRSKYERERQPRVIRAASGFVSAITSGKYARILSPMGREEVELETPEGLRKDVAKLSRGTREQLYLALRFGLILEYALSAEPLPVIMDDILVNFDPGRSRAAACAILELSKSNQVMFFTCHPEIAELFAGLDPSILRFRVSRGEIVRV